MPAAVCFIKLTRDSVQALALMTQGEQKAGLAVGTVASLILLILDIKRVFDVGGCHDIHVKTAFSRQKRLSRRFFGVSIRSCFWWIEVGVLHV